jgi:hypothetical protein
MHSTLRCTTFILSALAHGKVAAYSIRSEKRRLSGTYGQMIFTGPNAFVS